MREHLHWLWHVLFQLRPKPHKVNSQRPQIVSDVLVDVLDVLKVEYKLISTKMITFCKLLIANLQLKNTSSKMIISLLQRRFPEC